MRIPKSLLAIVVLALAAGAAYWYWSPLLAVHNMRQAAEKKDADAFNEYVDYPKLRESLKGQFAAMLAGEMAKSASSGDPYARAGSALGAMLGKAMVDGLVDALVRPEAVMRLMAEAKLNPKQPAPASPPTSKDTRPDVAWTFERKGGRCPGIC